MKSSNPIQRYAALALCIGTLAACGEGGGGGGTTAPEGPGSVAPTSSTSQTAFAGSTVTEAPAVRVTDARGRPRSGVIVAFDVTSGGGRVAAVSAATDADGRASAGSWTLGSTAGMNTLSATPSGMSSVQFTATGTARPPASIAKVSGEPQTGTAGAQLGQPLVVRVSDATGAPSVGTAVNFAVTGGGGTLGTTSALTDAQGLAGTTLTLGRQPGVNTVQASAGGGALSVTFTLTAQAAPAAVVTKAAGDNQQAPAGTAVAVAPTVLVADAFGNPVAGVAVTFAVGAGGGSVTSGSTATGADGRAAVGRWTLGPTAGTQTLVATAAGLPSVTFVATAIANAPSQDPCTTAVAFTLRTLVNGTLASTDCRLSTGEYIDFYAVSFPTARIEEFLLTSTQFDAYVELFDAAGRLVAFDDDEAGNNNSLLRVFAPSGQYFVGASSFSPAQGSYQLSSRAPTAPTTCVDGWIVPGVTVSGVLESGDCRLSDGSFADVYLVFLRAGQQITITQRSTAFDSFLILQNEAGANLRTDDDSGGGLDSRIVFSATQAGVYQILANTFSSTGTGAYTLGVSTP